MSGSLSFKKQMTKQLKKTMTDARQPGQCDLDLVGKDPIQPDQSSTSSQTSSQSCFFNVELMTHGLSAASAAKEH
jgi:hypothetical protein